MKEMTRPQAVVFAHKRAESAIAHYLAGVKKFSVWGHDKDVLEEFLGLVSSNNIEGALRFLTRQDTAVRDAIPNDILKLLQEHSDVKPFIILD